MAASRPERRLEAAVKHVGKRWLPINEALLAGINAKLSGGDYAEHREDLVDDVKNDPALYLYWTRAATKIVGGVNFDPISLLRELDEGRLTDIFNIKPRDISRHELRDMSHPQALAMQNSLFSARAAETIAARTGLQPETAFSAAYFRQLGLNLVAWNYPLIYREALVAHRKHKTDLEGELAELLGVTARQIGAAVAAECGMNSAARESVLITTAPGPEPMELVKRGPDGRPRLDLLDLCRLAELYGQLKDRANYPNAKQQWERNCDLVVEAAGSEVFQEIEEKVEQAINCHAAISSAVLALPAAERLLGIRPSLPDFDFSSMNPYAKKCPPSIRTRLLRVYEAIEDNRISLRAIHELINNVVPEMGFRRGCLFLVKRPQMELAPALRMGDYPLEAYGRFLRERNIGIQNALHGLAPYMQEAICVDRHNGINVCGAFGDADHPGVLYLELAPESMSDEGHDPILYFHALRHALNHCFGSKPDDDSY